MPQVALASLLRQPAVTRAILGAKRGLDQLEDNLGAATVTLSAQELGRAHRHQRAADRVPGLTPEDLLGRLTEDYRRRAALDPWEEHDPLLEMPGLAPQQADLARSHQGERGELRDLF